MRRLVATVLLGCVILACGGGGPPGAAPTGAGSVPAKKFVEGQDYVVLERLRVIDPNGFAQPMEAYSVLVPRGWTSEGGIRWNVPNTCLIEAIQNRVTVRSPDGAWVLDVYPNQQWDWWDDQMMLQTMMQQAQNPVFRRCPIARPLDAAQFLREPMAQEMGAQVVDVQPNEELAQVMRQQAQSANQMYQQAGVALEERPSAAIATLRYPDGSPGIAVVSIKMTLAWMPNYMTGGQSASTTCQTISKVALKMPPGKEEEGRKLLSVIMSSSRVNPEWQAGIQRMVKNISDVEQQEIAKRTAIQREAMQYSADLQQRTWEGRQASNDRIAESWGQTLRGVETWSDPGGGSIELSAGYNEAWSRPDGTYILSNDPLFDPTVVFQENWNRLQKR